MLCELFCQQNYMLKKESYFKVYKTSCFGWFMEFNATFNYISVILWRSVLLVEENGVPLENHMNLKNFVISIICLLE
jgi:hypothetical protein